MEFIRKSVYVANPYLELFQYNHLTTSKGILIESDNKINADGNYELTKVVNKVLKQDLQTY